MHKKRGSVLCLLPLILCLCICNLAISGISYRASLSVLQDFSYDLEGYNLFDQLESDDDFLAVPGIDQAAVNFFTVGISLTNPNFKSADLSLVLPPPKYS